MMGKARASRSQRIAALADLPYLTILKGLVDLLLILAVLYLMWPVIGWFVGALL